MEKFNRVYTLSVEVDNGVNTSPLLPEFQANKNVTITLPYTVEFEISRRALSSAQTGTFRVFNLGLEVRNAIQKDIFQYTQLRAIQFRAGYDSPNGKFVPIVFNGTVLTAYSYREGVNWVTEIEAFDGGWQMANANNVSLTLAPGASAASVITQLSRQLPNISGTPIVGNFPVSNLRGEALFGNAWQLILQKSNGLATIDNGQVKALNYYEVIQGEIPLISSETGLLGSPKRTTSTLEFDMIFEPRLTVGQIVLLKSSANKQFNRPWKVLGFDHRGTISASVGGDCLTSVRLWFTTQGLEVIPGTPVQ
jgi:hypothetical protein